MLPSAEGPRPLHLYARRHGDLERVPGSTTDAGYSLKFFE